ncbi:MAG: universal stress protein [Pseudomonadota bacterium]|nr:universal stress protein [Pseudomonadota bacterium]
MHSYQHILLAVDFSEHGDYVTRKAKCLADNFHAKLSIIHVLDNIPMPDTAYGTAIPLYESSSYELLEEEKFKLMQIGDRLGIDSACRWMIWGVPEQEIVRIADQEHIDLIVVGSHGRHGLALLLGSTTDSVLHHAKCDVLAVHLQDEAAREESVDEGAVPITLNPENA